MSFTNEVWFKSSIGKDCVFVKDGTHGTHKNTPTGVPLLSAKDIYNNIIDINNNPRLISINDYNLIYKKTQPKANDVLITIVGTVGRTALIPNNFPKFAFQRSVGWLRCKETINPSFYNHLLNSRNVQNCIFNKINASAQGGIYLNSLETVTTFIPSISAQNKISLFLNSINERINTQNKIIEDLIALKKNICDSFFYSLNKTDNFVLIDRYLNSYNEKTTTNNQYRVLSSTASGIMFQDEYFKKETSSADTTGYKVIPFGYCTYRSMSDTGEFYFNKQTIIDKGIVSPAYPVFKISDTYCDYILLNLNENPYVKKQILAGKSGGTRFALPYSKLIKIKLPLFELNKCIFSFTSLIMSINKKIENEKLVLVLLKKQKDYLLNNLFI